MANQISWISLSPVAGAIENGYGYGATAISLLGMTFMIVFVIMNIPANLVINKYGLRLAVSVGMGFTFLGMVSKSFINKSFGWVIMGQILAATGQPMLSIAPAKLATQWFGPNEVSLRSRSYKALFSISLAMCVI